METKECPYATHILHLKCNKCDLVDLVFCKDAKDWNCPICKVVEGNLGEVLSWRHNFLDEIFKGSFKFIPEDHKNRLRAYFLSIPSDSFTDPWNEWNKCVSNLLQYLEITK